MYDPRKLDALLKWYRQEVGKALISVIIAKRTGEIVESLAGYSKKALSGDFIGSISGIVQIIIKRMTLETELGAFGAGTFDTANYRLIFCEAGPNHVFVTVLNPLVAVDYVFPYTYLTAEKVARVFDGRTVSPVIPKIYSKAKSENVERKLNTFQKLKIQSAEYAYKLILGGDGAVGKTSMVHRFVENSFQTDYKSTIGTSIMKKECEFEGLDSKVRFVIWDLAGQDQYKRVRMSYLKNSEAGILVYDITRRNTFENIKNWREEIIQNTPENIILILVGNKKDLTDQRAVSTLEGEQLAQELGLPFIETSAKTGENINDAFRMLAFQLIKGYIQVENVYKIEDYQPIAEPVKARYEEEVNRMKEVKEKLSFIEKRRFKFWDLLVSTINKSNLKMPVLKKKIIYSYIISSNWYGIELGFYHETAEINRMRFKQLMEDKSNIQKDFASCSWHLLEDLEWDYKEDRAIQFLRYRFSDGGLDHKYQWENIQSKMIDGMRCFTKIMQKYLDRLD